MLTAVPAPPTSPAAPIRERPTFESVYGAGFTHVWHTLRRLGVPEADLEDAAHEVFVVVHRRLDTYEPARSLKAWLTGIAYRVASDDRRRAHRREERPTDAATLEACADAAPGADELVSRAQARALVLRALESLPLERRLVFVMAELDEVPGPEIAHALELPLNTVYSRLRLAREDFAQAVRRLQARQSTREEGAR